MKKYIPHQACLYLDRSRIFLWHQWLAEALVAAGCEVSIRYAPERHPLPEYCTALFKIEKMIYRIKRNTALDRIDTLIEGIGNVAQPFNVLIDFANSAGPLPSCERIITPVFNGIPGEIGAMAGLINTIPLVIQLHDSGSVDPWIAHPALNDSTIFIRSLDNVLSVAVGLILKAVNTPPSMLANSVSLLPRVPYGDQPVVSAAMRRATTTFANKLMRYLSIAAKGHKNWTVAWRDDPISLLDKKTAKFTVLPNDGKRYYADPFPYRHNIFVEEYANELGRGCISVSNIENGIASIPRPVIVESHHLSYPFIFEDNGEIWMIPESGDARSINLYRAECFPYKWKWEGCLIDNISGYDTTFYRHNGRFWLFVSEKMWHSTGWDTLNLYSSDKLTGSWSPHPQNPILIDPKVCRPGGAMFDYHNQILRPAQNCSHYYGGGLSLCRVDALGPEVFAQAIIGSIKCGSYGCHTYNNHAGLEVIDIFGRTKGLAEIEASFLIN